MTTRPWLPFLALALLAAAARAAPMGDLGVDFHGRRHADLSDLKEVIARLGRAEASDLALEDLAARLREALRRQGFPAGEVGCRIEGGRLQVGLREGRRVFVRAVVLVGLDEDQTRRLTEELRLQPSGLWRPRPLDPDLLRDDAHRLLRALLQEGHLLARVQPHVRTMRRGRAAEVRFEIEPGPRFFFGPVDFVGRSTLASYRLDILVRPYLGQPFDRAALGRMVQDLEEHYRRTGYPDARVEALEGQARADHRVPVSLRIDEGACVRLGRLRIVGLGRTRRSYVERELEWSPGEYYDEDTWELSRENLYELGLFSSVRMELEPASVEASAGGFDPAPRRGTGPRLTLEPGETETRDILLALEESPPGDLRLGAGYGRLDGARLKAVLGYRNLFGRAKAGALEGTLTQRGHRAKLRYDDPRVLGHRLRGRLELERREEYEVSFTLRQIGLRAALERGLFERVQGSLRLRLDQSEVFALERGLSADSLTRTVGLRTGLERDSRDDPVQPRRGFLLSASAEPTGGPLGGETHLVRYEGFAGAYRGLGEHAVLAADIRGGIISRKSSDAEIPIEERFFAGGENSVRGFAERRLGPENEFGKSVGGAVLAVANLELRLRLYESLWATAFHDLGEVRERQRDLDLHDLRRTAGGGLAYFTPVGPIRLEAGHKLDRRRGEPQGEIHFSVGFAF